MKFISTILMLCMLTLNVTDINAQVTKLFNNNNIEYGIPLGGIGVLLSTNDSLWRTDGTPAGTYKYATNVSVDSNSSVAILAGKIYFTGVTSANGYELWVTDGTPGGTSLVKDIQVGNASSNPSSFIVFNNTLYFVATTPGNGTEVWKSDGTDPGTVMLKDINLGPGNGAALNTPFYVANGNLYFPATDGANGFEPWITNGTGPATIMLKDINPGAGDSNPGGFTALATNVIFTASEPSTGAELYKTNGTPLGTGMLADIATGFFGSNPLQFLLFNSKLFFTALTLSNGFELWSTDGTTTSLVKDIDPGFNSSFPLLFNAVFIGSKFYFSASTLNDGTELWGSDGTTLGTQMLKDINPGPGSSDPLILLDFYSSLSLEMAHSNLFNGKIFLEANNGTNGNELWITDGTLAGTVMVKDINPGADSSLANTYDHIYTQNALFISATNGSTGYELHRSNGTIAGTTPVIDLYPGVNGSFPEFVMILNNRIIFTANDGDNPGFLRDLYKIDEIVSPLPLQLLDFTATPSGKMVQVNWLTTSEVNVSHFEIERSKDGLLFEKLGQVNALNSALNNSYAFKDINALLLGAEKLFYRLKIIDKDGKYSYSKIAVVNIRPGKDIFYVYPNPAHDKLLIMINSSKEQTGSLIIYDASGKQVYSKSVIAMQGVNQQNISVSALADGVYNIRFITPEGTRSLQFVKN